MHLVTVGVLSVDKDLPAKRRKVYITENDGGVGSTMGGTSGHLLLLAGLLDPDDLLLGDTELVVEVSHTEAIGG